MNCEIKRGDLNDPLSNSGKKGTLVTLGVPTTSLHENTQAAYTLVTESRGEN